MKDWKAALQALVARADDLSDRARLRLSRLASVEAPLLIVPYVGYGNAERLVSWGRVLQNEHFRPPLATHTRWRNFVEFYKRLESDEVPGARVRARFQGHAQDALTDSEGYFGFEWKPDRSPAASGWQTVELELLEPVPPDSAPVRASGLVLVPAATATFGVISDIDDTVVQTHVTDKLEMLLTVALSNARTRKPFQGAAAFYRALHKGAGGSEGNPIFYVSSSPWNLYTPLVEFLSAQGIQAGPLFLKDFGDHTLFSMHEHHGHKLRSIERILDDFPHLRFILIGDSGEQDPEIYAEVAARHPRRISVIYIRSVNPDPSRLAAIDRLVEQVRPTEAQLVLAPDSEFAAVHAAAGGLIATSELAAVRQDKRDDAQPGEPQF